MVAASCGRLVLLLIMASYLVAATTSQGQSVLEMQEVDAGTETDPLTGLTSDEQAILNQHFTSEQQQAIHANFQASEAQQGERFSQVQNKGFFSGLAKGAMSSLGAARPKESSSFTGAAKMILPQDEACIMCQYFIEKIQAAVMESVQSPTPPSFIEEDIVETPTKSNKKSADAFTSLLELKSTIQAKLKSGTKFSNIGGTGMGFTGGGLSTLASRPSGPGNEVGFMTTGRMRSVAFLGDMPLDLRFSPLVNPSANAEQDRAKWKLMEMEVYAMIHQLCSTSIPLMYLVYCQAAMSNFQRILQSLHYGDRPDQICIVIGQCLPDSYSVIRAHSVVRIDPKDLKARLDMSVAMSPSKKKNSGTK